VEAMKRVLIIGGGIAGLTAGVFAQRAGFKSIILEKHSIPGGECTGWDRGEYHIDGCIHWLTGTKEGHELNRLWKQVGALENVEIYKPDKFATVEHMGKQLSIYRDLNRLREQLLEASPEDEAETEQLISRVKALGDVGIPSDKPIDLMSPIELVKLGMSMRNEGKVTKALSKLSVKEYGARFKSPLIRKALSAIVPSEYSAVSLIFTLAVFAGGNGDYPLGGSRAMARRMAEKYLSLGGELRVNTEAEEIIVENGTAAGVFMKDGSFEKGDYIIPACDTHVTFNRLLKGMYFDKQLEERYCNPSQYPLYSCLYLSFAVDEDMKDYPESFVFDTAPISCGIKKYSDIYMHHYCFDSFAPKGKSVLICTFMTDEADYHFWKGLKQEPSKYVEEKRRLADKVIAAIEARFPELQGKISLLDAATPLTYERYCGAYQGAWMSFALLPGSKQMLHNGRVKGIDNLYMAGQWLIPPGGLPVALVTGKWAIQRICKKEKLRI
jgi:phytoene desaturase